MPSPFVNNTASAARMANSLPIVDSWAKARELVRQAPKIDYLWTIRHPDEGEPAVYQGVSHEQKTEEVFLKRILPVERWEGPLGAVYRAIRPWKPGQVGIVFELAGESARNYYGVTFHGATPQSPVWLYHVSRAWLIAFDQESDFNDKRARIVEVTFPGMASALSSLLEGPYSLERKTDETFVAVGMEIRRIAWILSAQARDNLDRMLNYADWIPRSILDPLEDLRFILEYPETNQAEHDFLLASHLIAVENLVDVVRGHKSIQPRIKQLLLADGGPINRAIEIFREYKKIFDTDGPSAARLAGRPESVFIQNVLFSDAGVLSVSRLNVGRERQHKHVVMTADDLVALFMGYGAKDIKKQSDTQVKIRTRPGRGWAAASLVDLGNHEFIRSIVAALSHQEVTMLRGGPQERFWSIDIGSSHHTVTTVDDLVVLLKSCGVKGVRRLNENVAEIRHAKFKMVVSLDNPFDILAALQKFAVSHDLEFIQKGDKAGVIEALRKFIPPDDVIDRVIVQRQEKEVYSVQVKGLRRSMAQDAKSDQEAVLKAIEKGYLFLPEDSYYEVYFDTKNKNIIIRHAAAPARPAAGRLSASPKASQNEGGVVIPGTRTSKRYMSPKLHEYGEISRFARNDIRLRAFLIRVYQTNPRAFLNQDLLPMEIVGESVLVPLFAVGGEKSPEGNIRLSLLYEGEEIFVVEDLSYKSMDAFGRTDKEGLRADQGYEAILRAAARRFNAVFGDTKDYSKNSGVVEVSLSQVNQELNDVEDKEFNRLASLLFKGLERQSGKFYLSGVESLPAKRRRFIEARLASLIKGRGGNGAIVRNRPEGVILTKIHFDDGVSQALFHPDKGETVFYLAGFRNNQIPDFAVGFRLAQEANHFYSSHALNGRIPTPQDWGEAFNKLIGDLSESVLLKAITEFSQSRMNPVKATVLNRAMTEKNTGRDVIGLIVLRPLLAFLNDRLKAALRIQQVDFAA